MKATEARLLEFLRKSPKFAIPIFQRTYSWTERECRQLWDDILRTGKHDEIPGHFIGSIMYVVENGQSIKPSPFLVIDGQQRLTTVSLILEALARVLGNTGSVNGFSSDKIRDDYLLCPMEKGARIPRLELTQTDNISLITVLNQKHWPREHSIQLRENFEFFEKKITAIGEDISSLCKGLDKLIIVDIALTSDQDNPQLIFESMNSTGKELTQADLIRNFILMGLDSEQQKHIYDYYWRPMEVMFGQDAYRTDFDDFMRHYLTAKTSEIPRINDVYETFKTYTRTPEIASGGLDSLLLDMGNYAGYYCDMAFGRESDKDLEHAFQDLRELGVDVVYPFLLELYHDYATDELPKTDFLIAIRLVETYIFRRAVCAIPSNSHGTIFATFSRNLNKDHYLESIKAHFILLLSYRSMPDDEEFIRDLKARNLYNFRCQRYWLRRLENHGRKESVSLDDYTTEHILPQNENLSHEWQKSLGDDWKRIQDTWLHTLGNLTLTGYNSEYSDRPFNEKRDMEDGFKDSPIKLNKDLGSVDKWNEDAIKTRADKLADMALIVWRAPTLSPEVLAEYQPEKPIDSGPTIDDLEYLARDRPMRSIFDSFRKEVLALDPGVTEKIFWTGTCYYAGPCFLDVVPQVKRLRLTLNMVFNEISDPEGLCRDVTDLKRYGDVEISLSSMSELPYVMSLVWQAFEKQELNNKKTSKQTIPEEILPRLREIITKAHWIFAKTYAKTAPHEYCLREDKNRGNVSAADILFFAECIRDYGYKELFYSHMQTYLDIDDHKYWSMDPTPEETDLINRAPLTAEGIADLVRENGF